MGLVHASEHLSAIAQATGQPEIIFIIGPTFRFGNNMLDLKYLHGIALMRQAVTTPISCNRTNASADVLGNLSCGHGCSGGIKPR